LFLRVFVMSSKGKKRQHPSKDGDVEEGEVYMELRNRSVKTPKESDRKKKDQGLLASQTEEEHTPVNKERKEEEKNEEEEDIDSEVIEKTVQQQKVYMQLRGRKVMTPVKSSSKRKKPVSKEDVEKAEVTVKRILEKRSKDTTDSTKKTVMKEEKPKSRTCLKCLAVTVFVIFAIIALVSGAYGFFSAQGKPVMLSRLIDYDGLLGADNAKPVKDITRHFDQFYVSLDTRMQVLSASAVFFVACGVCGLCWLARMAVKASEAKIDPVERLEDLLNLRRKIIAGRQKVSDRLDAGNQTQDARVECLKRLQIYDTELNTIEEHISLLWIEFGDELLAAYQVPIE